MKSSAVIFDLDGTIHDRAQDIRAFANNQFNRLGAKPSLASKYNQRFVELDANGMVWKDKVYEVLSKEFALVDTQDKRIKGIKGIKGVRYKLNVTLNVSSSRPVPLNDISPPFTLLFWVRFTARGYSVIVNGFLIYHQLLPSPSQNRACATHAHGSSLERFTKLK